MFNTIGLTARTDQKKAVKLAEKLIHHLETKGCSVLLETELAEKAGRREIATPVEKMKTDLIATIGGDGTILRTCLSLPKPEPPILAINMGVRGFLAEVQPNESIKALDDCLEGKFMLERCAKLASFIGETKLPDALNEVFVSTGAPAKLLYAKIWKDSVEVTECRADGVIVASQVGSTAYSLSAGGPVLDPQLDVFVLTPVCPLTVFHPIVFSAKSTVTIEPIKPKRVTIVIDGDYQKGVQSENPRITITKSKYETTFIRFEENFYHRLKARLLFPGGA
ncbi:MAG: NAD(+)/NADH kinase [Thermoproteota archaeon]|nr:NAD(+)/NADH kinase [Thermoproteota archaeon]